MDNQTVMDNFFALYKTLLDEVGLNDKPAQILNAYKLGIDLNSKAGKLVLGST